MKELAERLYIELYLRHNKDLPIGGISQNMAGAIAREALKAAGAFEVEVERLVNQNDG